MTNDLVSRAGAVLGNFQIREYLDIGRRRKWWIVLTTMSVSLTTWFVVLRLPNIYRAESVILVDPQKVPENYIASTVSTSIGDRLSTIQQEVMSPTRLRQLIDSMGLYADLKGRLNDQEIITVMQKAVSVEVVDPGARRLNAFRIVFRGKNRVEVAQVANQLAAMFIEANLKAREQQSFGTAEFLDAELAKTQQELEKKENELQTIKARYIMELPESKQYHLEALESLRGQLRASQDRVNQAHQQKIYLQSLSSSNVPTIDMDAESSISSPFQSQIQKLETNLSGLEERYGPNYPDVRKLKLQIDELRAKAEKQEKSGSAVPAIKPARQSPQNPVLEMQIADLNTQIEEQTKLQPKYQEEINFHVAKLQRIPIFEQQISGLLRDYDTLRTHYTSLLDKKFTAQTANALESRQKGERFVVLDAAQVPEKPFAPKRTLLFVGGFLGGMLAGIVLAMLREMSDESVRDERELAAILGKPVLASIPRTLNRRQIARKRVLELLAVMGTGSASFLLAWTIYYFSKESF